MKYVEGLIGPDTINTMPDSTLAAFLDHGQVGAGILDDLDGARRAIAELGEAGIDLDEVCAQLQREGVRKFAESADSFRLWVGERECALAAAPLPPA